ncbi:MAG: T9SS type A sorting domain-containing protein [Flavobacterium sp.]|nr:MAG: T9SS type A sorting domain-containing protein [Flavobacterium sp.]
MKNLYLLFAVCTFSIAEAQVPNPGFEETLSDGFTLKNWGSFLATTVTIDENGNSTSDEIIFQSGNGFCSPVGNCVTGSWSMMLTNAMNMTQNTVIPGKASLFNDAESETATGWNNGYPIAPGADVSLLGFDYQFFPMTENEVAEATLELFGASGQSVGKAVITISGFSSDFNYVYAPVEFTSAEAPAFMTIEFNMAKEGSTPEFGSMLLVDNVKVNFSPLGNNTNTRDLFTVFPTITSGEINIVKGNAATNDQFNVTIIDATGKIVKQQTVELGDSPVSIDTGKLASGVYFLKASSKNASNVARFIKK